MEIGVFGFILILIIGLSLIEAGTKILVPVSRRLADLIAESVKEKRLQREPGGAGIGGANGEEIASSLEELERRLLAIEDRLDFLEELRAPERRPRIMSGEDRE